MFKECLENRIVSYQENNYKCYWCHIVLENDSNSVLKHIEDLNHQQKLQKLDEAVRNSESEALNTISISDQRLLVHNGIAYNSYEAKPTILRCRICKCTINGLKNAIQHVKGDPHKIQMKLKIDEIDPAKKVEAAKKTCTTAKVDTTKVQTATKKDNRTVNNNASPNLVQLTESISWNVNKNIYECATCNCTISGDSNVVTHIGGNSHNTKLEENASLKTNVTADFLEMRYCAQCNFFIKTSAMLQIHVMIHLHKEVACLQNKDIMSFRFNESGNSIKCMLCNITVSIDEKLLHHLESEIHSKRLELFMYIKDDIELDDEADVQVYNENMKELKFNSSKEILFASRCNTCNKRMPGRCLSEHIMGQAHSKNVSKSLTQSNGVKQSSFSPCLYRCFICEKSIRNLPELFSHYNSDEHRRKMTCFMLIYKSPYMTFAKLQTYESILCKLCKINGNSCRAALQHLLGKGHQNKVELSKKDKEQCAENKENINSLNVNQSSATAKSKINNIINLNPSYIKTKSEINNINLNQSNVRTKPESNIININQSSIKSKSEINNLNINQITVNTNLENNDFKASYSKKTEDMNEMLNSLVKLDLSNTQKKRMFPHSITERNLRTPVPKINKSSMFNDKVILFGKTFIERCIDPGKKNMYTIDPEDFRLFKFGTTLTFLYESDRICMPCGEQFPNDKQLLFDHLHSQEHIENLLQMIEDDEDFENKGCGDQFSDLKLAKCYMQSDSADCVKCFACSTKVKDEDSHIHLHILSSKHQTKSDALREQSDKLYQELSIFLNDAWYYAEKFACEICTKKFEFEIDFVKHLEKSDHLYKTIQLKQEGDGFNTCPVCITHWYGKSNSYDEHCKSSIHKRLSKNGDFMAPNMTVCTTALLSNVDEKIDFLIKESDKVALEKLKEQKLLIAIEDAMRHMYPNATAYTFGSRISDLGFPDSDVDVFLDCEGVYYKGTSQEQSQQYLLSVKESFETRPNIWVVDELILITRVPIIKLRHIPTTLKCDISFINGLSVEKSTLIGHYNAAYPICRKLILFLKKWLTYCQLTGPDIITTFATSWYVIFYLQVKHILPSVHNLITLKNESKIVDGWECGFMEHFLPAQSNLSFKDHLKGFFTYYANFDYKTNVACPYLGKVIKKCTFAQLDRLPKEMSMYVQRIRSDNLEMFRFDSPMCIQDPIDLSQNMTKAVKKQHLRCFRQYCAESALKV